MKFKYQILIFLFSFSSFHLPGQEQPELQIGGALRFNYIFTSLKEYRKASLVDFGYGYVESRNQVINLGYYF